VTSEELTEHRALLARVEFLESALANARQIISSYERDIRAHVLELEGCNKSVASLLAELVLARNVIAYVRMHKRDAPSVISMAVDKYDAHVALRTNP
jgi:hypothetical protein